MMLAFPPYEQASSSPGSVLVWKESGAISYSPGHHTRPQYSRRDPASIWVTAWPGWHCASAPAHSGSTAPTCYITCKSNGGPTSPTSPPDCEVTLPPLGVTGTCPSTLARGTRLAALQATHQGKRPPGPPAAQGAGTCPQLPHVHCPALSKWPVLAGAHGSSRCGVWLSVPSWPHPHQPGPAWPGPVCSCSGGAGCCTRGGHSTPPLAGSFGS